MSRIGRSGPDWPQCADATKRLDGRLSETALGVAVDCREIAPFAIAVHSACEVTVVIRAGSTCCFPRLRRNWFWMGAVGIGAVR